MKYMLMMNAPGGGPYQIARWPEKDIKAHIGEPITDGVFPETKEFLAGYWIVDVETPQRAYAIAAEASAAPGPGGKPLNMPIEVRAVMSGPPPEFL